MRHHAPAWLALLATIVALVFVTRLELSPDVADLLPDAGEGAALRDYVRVFGQGDLGMVLVRGTHPEQTRNAADAATLALRKSERVRAVVDRVQLDVPDDPSLAWAVAGPTARRALAESLTSEGMSQRLRDSRRLLLAPGSASVAQAMRLDPLRLRQLPFESELRVAGSARASPAHALSKTPTGWFVADGGRTRLLLVSAEGQSLRGKSARAFVDSVNASLEPVRRSIPNARFDLTGGHAIAAETEQVLRRDLVLSGALSTLLAALAFGLAFRRLRALVAVLPPLALGTLWTAATASMVFERMSALTLGFLAVVIGVGLDTGIHVYASLLDARRQGLAPGDAAAHARRDTARPTLLAAATAAIAFATLGMSEVPALRQFGLACAAGELLTALAILAVTPLIGGWLERGSPPPAVSPRWVSLLDRARRNQSAPLVLGIAVFIPIYVLFTMGLPTLGDRLVGIHPGAISSVETHEAIVERFGGGPGQWAVLIRDNDPNKARLRADRLFEALDDARVHIDALDGLARFAPALDTQRDRLRERDALNLAGRAGALREALMQSQFDPTAFDAALRAFTDPKNAVRDSLSEDSDAHRLFSARYLAREDGATWAALYVRPRPGHETAVSSLVEKTDPGARITGYARLESALASSVRTDLPRILWTTALLLGTAMILTLRRGRDVLVAAAALGFEVLWVTALIRWVPLPLHVYNAFVIPVLLGITVDEVMFLLHRTRGGGIRHALEIEGRNIVATAATTAAGFAALGICSFQGLADMGTLGAIGVGTGLLVALFVVPIVLNETTNQAIS